MGIKVVMPNKIDSLPTSDFTMYCVSADLDPYESDANRQGNNNAKLICHDVISDVANEISLSLPPGLYKIEVGALASGSPLNRIKFTHYGFEATGREIGVIRKMNDDDFIDDPSCNPIHISVRDNMMSVEHNWNPPPLETPIAGFWSYDTNQCETVYLVVNGSMQYYCVDAQGMGILATYRSLNIPGPTS